MALQFDKLSFSINPTVIHDDRDLDSSSLHIVATAEKKGGFCMEYLVKRGLPYKTVAEKCDVVNIKQEVGTLYPMYRFTLIPVQSAVFQLVTGALPDAYLLDIFKAHKLYYPKCNKILFILDKTAGYDLEAVKTSIQAYVESESPANPWMDQLSFLIASYP